MLNNKSSKLSSVAGKNLPRLTVNQAVAKGKKERNAPTFIEAALKYRVCVCVCAATRAGEQLCTFLSRYLHHVQTLTFSDAWMCVGILTNTNMTRLFKPS